MNRLILFLFATLLSTTIFASNLIVSDQYVRATPPHTKNSAAFLTLKNGTRNDIKLVSANSDIAERTELHTHTKENGMMKMRQVENILIKANSSTILQPGGYHIMFLGLKNDLAEGQIVNITLYFDNGEEIAIKAPIKKINMSHDKKHQ
jgi:copper(I)-binding protein